MPHCPICFEGDDDDYEYDDEHDPMGQGGHDADAVGNDDSTGEAAASKTTNKNKKLFFLVRGRYCNHGFCKPCVERVLRVAPDHPPTSPPRGSSSEPPSPFSFSRQLQQPSFGLRISPTEFLANQNVQQDPSNVTLSGVPTQGCCPLCRARLSLFDLTWRVEPKNGQVDDDDKELKADDDDNDDERTSSFVYKNDIITDWRQTPLFGKVYTNASGLGRFSFHFTEDDDAPYDDDNDHEGNNNKVPYVNVQEILKDTGNPHRIATSSAHVPLRNVQWHPPSRTLRAVMVNPLTQTRALDEIILNFSNNYMFVRAGARISHWKGFSSVNELHQTFPMDGMYQTSLVDSNGNHPADEELHTTKTIQVQGHKFVLDRIQYEMRHYPAQGKVFVLCPEQMDLSRQGNWNFRLQPLGPCTGDCFLCPVGPGLLEKWTMLHKSTTTPSSEVIYMGLRTTDPAGRYRLSTTSELIEATIPPVVPGYHAESLHGNVFCQHDTVGLASYHFSSVESNNDGDDNSSSSDITAYISYESHQVSRWPPLDDGTRPPLRVPFHNTTYDDSTRTFRGSICWWDEYGTTWQHMARWEYEMILDTDFTCIVSGTVKGYTPAEDMDGGEGREISRYGENLVYTNAALDEYFGEGATSSSNSTSTDATSSPSSVLQGSEHLRERLRSEGATVRTIAAVHKSWAATAKSRQRRTASSSSSS